MIDEYTRRRLEMLETQVAALAHRVYRLERGSPTEVAREIPEAPRAEPTPEPGPTFAAPEPATTPLPSDPVITVPEPLFASAAAAPRSSAEWEAALGGNWLNRIGASVLVVGIALLLGYSFRHMGPAGRDAAGWALGIAMLAGGVFYERREKYRNFARGLIGGGWAAIYFTAYAMQALDAARVIHNPLLASCLLMLVAGGMILHALRYRSEAAAGVAYFSAFLALALSEANAFSLVALLPLAASLLYLARRFRWRRLAVLGLIATYVVCGSRGDTGAPLWAAQAVFAVYWLLFEGFEILVPGTWLMPLNAAGFLFLSIVKWNADDPGHVWAFLAVTAAAYGVAGAVRAWRNPGSSVREGSWHGPATAAAGLAAAAIMLRLERAWELAAFLGVGELYFAAGLRLRAKYLRFLAVPLFLLELVCLCLVIAPRFPVSVWAPVAALTAAVFYCNRALHPADIFYSYAGTGVAALVGGAEAPARECGRIWFAMAGAPFVVGWWLPPPGFSDPGIYAGRVGGIRHRDYRPAPAAFDRHRRRSQLRAGGFCALVA